MYDIIIVGAGPAGLTAALYARRAGHTVLILEGGVPGGQAATTPNVENWPGTPAIGGADFAMNLYQQVQDLGAEVTFAAVTGLRDEGAVKTVLAGEQAFQGRAVILANGVRRRKLDVPGEERLAGSGVSYCATCDGMLYRGRAVAVWGLSPEAPQEANFLHGIGCSVTYIAGRRPDTLEAGVAFRAGRVEAVEGGAAVEAVRVGGAALPVQGVFILRAATPPDALVPGLALENGFVKTDAAMRTNIPGLFAAGDMTGKPLQVANAVGDGLVAALAAVDYLDGVSPMTD